VKIEKKYERLGLGLVYAIFNRKFDVPTVPSPYYLRLEALTDSLTFVPEVTAREREK
jgi:hypothetical protein